MAYQYVTYNENGEVVKGRIATAAGGTGVLEVAPRLSFASWLTSVTRHRLTVTRVKPGEVVLFYRQLALLIESGIDIVTSLGLLRAQTSSRALGKVLNDIIATLQGGVQLSVALARHPEVFPPMCCQSLKVGEHTGNLEVMLRQLADYVEKNMTTTKNLKNALMLPAITAVVALVVVSILVVVVMPAFNNLYTSLGAELPFFTRALLSVSAALQEYGFYILITILLAVTLAFAYIHTPGGRLKWHRQALRLPLVGRINHLHELARCCRSISLLFRAGLPLTEILPLVIQGCTNAAVINALVEVNWDMLKGEGLSRPLAKHDIFLPMMVQMVKVGEETGNLDATLFSVAQSYETEAEDRTRSLIGLIQPVMTLVIGLVVGLVTLSLISAMYSMYGQMS